MIVQSAERENAVMTSLIPWSQIAKKIIPRRMTLLKIVKESGKTKSCSGGGGEGAPFSGGLCSLTDARRPFLGEILHIEAKVVSSGLILQSVTIVLLSWRSSSLVVFSQVCFGTRTPTTTVFHHLKVTLLPSTVTDLIDEFDSVGGVWV